MIEPVQQFEGRKRDHIDLALQDAHEAFGLSGFDSIQLQHEALPDLNFQDVSISTKRLGIDVNTPFFVSSMTAGHAASVDLNSRLARAGADRGWWMGVGSQRRELFDAEARKEWLQVRAQAPQVRLMANLGIAQVIQTPVAKVQELVDVLEATAMIVHLNALQECLQLEGTPSFRGGLNKIAELVRGLPVPVIIKETGCGIGVETMRRLNETGVAAVDVSGLGGTHWGRIEGSRAEAAPGNWQAQAATTFANWGIGTAQALMSVIDLKLNCEIWASGGIRSGLDAAKALSMGAGSVGVAKPILQAALLSEAALEQTMFTFEQELRVALFCTGSQNITELKAKGFIQNGRK